MDSEAPEGVIDTIGFIALIVCGCVGTGLSVYWGALAYHAIRTAVRVPTARDGLPLAAARGRDSWARVCAIVPAHNEESCIGLVAESLAKQDYPSLSAVFALDRCTDGTDGALRAAVGNEDRFEIVHVAECPAEWSGKTHAIWRAVQDSKGARGADLLLFIDADTVLEPGCVRACVALMESRGLAMLSLLSTMTHDRWFERVVQPAAGMELIRQYPIERANARTHTRPFANGQFILIRRDAYDSFGGHEGIREALLEDVRMARELHHRKIPAGMFLAAGMLHCRMYSAWEEFRRGWKRIYMEAANRQAKRLRSHGFRVRVLGLDLPLIALAGVVIGFARGPAGAGEIVATLGSALGLVAMGVALGVCYKMSRTPVWLAAAYPVGAWHVWRIMRQAAEDLERGTTVSWGGRMYRLTAR